MRRCRQCRWFGPDCWISVSVLFGSWPAVVHSMLSVHVIFADVMMGSYLYVSSCPPCIGTRAPVLPAYRRIVGLNPVLVCWATRKNLSCDPELFQLCRRSSGLRCSGKGYLKKKKVVTKVKLMLACVSAHRLRLVQPSSCQEHGKKNLLMIKLLNSLVWMTVVQLAAIHFNISQKMLHLEFVWTWSVREMTGLWWTGSWKHHMSRCMMQICCACTWSVCTAVTRLITTVNTAVMWINTYI